MTSLKNIRGAILMGLAWAVAWAPIGVLIGIIVDPNETMDEMWGAVGAYPGFLAGVAFSAALRMVEGVRRLDETPLLRVGAWGAAIGLLVGSLPFLLIGLGAASTENPIWLLAAVFIPPVTFLGAASAVGSALLARFLKKRSALRLDRSPVSGDA